MDRYVLSKWMSWVKIRVNFQQLSHRPLTTKDLVQFQARQGENRCGESGRGRNFSPSTSVFPVSVIQAAAHIQLRLGVARSRRTNDQSLLDNRKGKLFQKPEIVGYNLTTGLINSQPHFLTFCCAQRTQIRAAAHRTHCAVKHKKKPGVRFVF